MPLTPHGGCPRPLPLPAEPAPRPALATALATSGLLPLVSPGKRSAAARRDRGRARTLGSGGAEDAWSCAKTRGLCRSESHSDPSCGSQRFCGDRGPQSGSCGSGRSVAGPRRRSCCVSLVSGALVPVRPPACLRSCGPFGERASKFFFKKSFFFFAFFLFFFLLLTIIFSAVRPKKSLFRQS